MDERTATTLTASPPAGVSTGYVSPITLAPFFALFSAIGELVLTTMRKTVWVHPDWPLSSEYFWMTPLADVLLFLSLGVLLAVLGRVWPRLRQIDVPVFAFTFLCVISWLTILPWFAWYAQLALALGISVQIASLARRRETAVGRALRFTIGWSRRLFPGNRGIPLGDGHGLVFAAVVLIVLGLVATGSMGWRGMKEQTERAQLLPARQGVPNVLLVVWDTVRAMNLSLYGYERNTTPLLDRRAEQGLVFENAIAPASWTLPSHAAMFTGRWHHEISADWFNPLDDEFTTLSEVLSRNGYVTAGFASNTSYCTPKHGLDRGFLHYESFPVSAGQIFASSSIGRLIIQADWPRNLIGHHHLPNGTRATVLNEHALDWLTDKGDRPFFVFLNYFDAHEPVLPPEPYHSRFAPRKPWGRFEHLMNASEHADKDEMSADEVQTMIDRYDGAIAYLDNALDELLAELDQRGLLENTLVIVVSDHGEHWGEKGLFDHGRSLYQELIHVPLVVFPPGPRQPGRRVSAAVSLRDIPATVMDYLQLPNTSFPGQSLTRFVDDPDLDADLILSQVNNERRRTRALIDESMKLIRTSGPDGARRELFDLAADPREERDMGSDSMYAGLVAQMESVLSDALSSNSVIGSSGLVTRSATGR